MSQESKRTATPQGTNTVALTTSKNHRLMVKVNTNIADLDMIVDTRAMLSIVSKPLELQWPVIYSRISSINFQRMMENILQGFTWCHSQY